MRTHSSPRESSSHAARPFFSRSSESAAATTPFFVPERVSARTELQAQTELEEPEERLQRKASAEADCEAPVLAPPPSEEASGRSMQTKLAIGASNDPLEREADRVADQTVAASGHSPINVEPPRIRRYSMQPSQGAMLAPESVDRVMASAGRPLEPALRQDMEQRFGHDFSRVRVHLGEAAEQSASEVRAKAYTVGPNIVFGAGRFLPGTNEGRRLIAHELTHVLQQAGVDDARAGGRYEKHDSSLDVEKHSTSLLRQADPAEEWQIACVRRLGGCASFRDGGLASIEDIKAYNLECRKETGYGEDVTPTDEECKNAKEASRGELSYELADAPSSPNPKARARLWLIQHRPEIEAAEARFKIDRRAIAGAIAWEAIENVRLAWTPSSVGPGKVHIYRDLDKGDWLNEDTVAKQTEGAGYLPKQNLEGRKNILGTARGAITYIAAIMRAGADIAFEEGRFDIESDIEVLTWYYNSIDLPRWRELIKAKQRGTSFNTSQNAMSVWTQANVGLLEAAVGKPSFQATHSPVPKLQKASLDDREPAAQADELEREASAISQQVGETIDMPASSEVTLDADPHVAHTPFTPQQGLVSDPTESPAAPAPNFTHDPGCVEAPTSPAVPAPLPFTPDPNAVLPANESAPDLSAIPSKQPWWADLGAQSFGEKLAECYALRTASSAKPVDKTAKLAELMTDFDRVVQGAFGRSKFGSWFGIGPALARILQERRAKIVFDETKVDSKLPKDKRRSRDDLNQAVETRMQRERYGLVEEVRIQVALGTWAWMVERREKLDFDTISQPYSGKSSSLPELLTDAEIGALAHEILVAKKQELTEKEIDKAKAVAQATKDNKAKQSKKEPAPLTDDEQTEAIFETEVRKVKERWSGELKVATIKARTAKDEADLLIPTKADIKGWTPDVKGTRIHKDVVALLKVLEGEFPKGFSAGTYQLRIEGDHASAGFEGRYRSLDMYPNGGPSRLQKPFGEIGFFDKQLAYDFALAIDRAISGKGTYQILYNDFAVAREVNRVVANGRMMNVDNVNDISGHPANLNWHGPLVTHFHVDFAI
jgi:hypothetical protein